VSGSTVWQSGLEPAELAKVSMLSRGLRIDQSAASLLSDGGRIPLSLHEYATTGGVGLRLADDVYVNAPFDDWFCSDPEASLAVDTTSEALVVTFRGHDIPAQALPLPGYIGVRDGQGRLVTDVAMSHCDRVRISPIAGCSFDCKFCDMAQRAYSKRPLEQVLAALRVAQADPVLPVRHVLISGGAPVPRDREYLDGVSMAVAEATDMPVDVMTPARDDPSWIDRLVKAGVHGFSINLEVYGSAEAGSLIRLKDRTGRRALALNLERALAATGGRGRVRSLIVVGLESLEATLAGVEFLAALGCDPVLSPFRPAEGTELASVPPPTAEFLVDLYGRAKEIVERHGVALGPRCVPCQNNTLTFPGNR
jgi:pyruvate-formate lyase-activating enzyme